MSDIYTILYDPSVVFFRYALVKPDGTVCVWSNDLSNLPTAEGSADVQSPDYQTHRGYIKLTLPSRVTTEEQFRNLYPEHYL